MKNAVRLLILITVVSMLFPLFGCGKSRQYDIHSYLDKPAGTLLVDWYSRTVGTPITMPYTELVLYTRSPDTVLLEHYTEGGSENERCDRYVVPAEEAQAVLDVIRKSGMERWNSRKELSAICGKSYVCKFPDGEGGYIRVTGEKMPQDGSRAFGEVSAAMYGLMKDEYREK